MLLELDSEQHVIKFESIWNYHLYLDDKEIWSGANRKHLSKATFPIKDGDVTRVLTITGSFFGSFLQELNEALTLDEASRYMIEIQVDGHELIRFQRAQR